ncbi:probable sodium/metabolite cotransporter BASS5, chloroplastic [Lactuca sativa]|uniref:probable sodium/metabolite cotransporter BASS5, chloroplastic n=1 Tax=Lactuca sativa TaxID=4236 RepID=UPI000CD9A35D|nr:probable sodium/metabolite cotransporter BASS5, chloroplastic [Lactuca sativa]
MILRSSVAQLHHHHHQSNQPSRVLPRKSSSENNRIKFPISPHTLSLSYSDVQLKRWDSRLVVHRRVSGEFSDGIIDQDEHEPPNYAQISPQRLEHKTSFVEIPKTTNSLLPQVVLASTILVLIFPPSYTWFTSRYYAPALCFLMFAVGIYSNEKDFVEAFNRPQAFFARYLAQFVQKPFIGYLFGTLFMTICGFPTSLGAGIMLTTCVSGAQLSNYATFLMDPTMAPLSIVATSLSTAISISVTPLLSLLLIGEKSPVDLKQMVSNILKIVISPLAVGLLLNRFLPRMCSNIRPFLPPLSILVSSICMVAPIAANINSVSSTFLIKVFVLVTGLHISAFVLSNAFLIALFSTIHLMSNYFRDNFLTKQA